jgi:hypothetical protein
VILPHALVNEVKSLPEDKISFKKHAYDRFLGRYTGLGQSKRPEAIQAIKIDLTRSISKVLSDLQDEAVYAFDREIGECSEWTEIPVYARFIQIVALTSGRAFVGLPLCRDPEWTESTINFTTDTLATVTAFRKFPALIWPVVSPFLPELRKLRAYRDFAAKKLRPQVSLILSAYKDNVKGVKTLSADDADLEAVKHNFNLVHWMIGHYKDTDQANAYEIGQLQMTSAFAAISPIGMAISYAVFDIAAHPEYAAVLREEIDTVLAEDNSPDGRLRKSSLPKLKKLDSFIKESQRMSPPFMSKFASIHLFRHSIFQLPTSSQALLANTRFLHSGIEPSSDCS